MEDYVREHKKTGSVFRHIHINHGPDIEKAIEAVKSEVSKNEFIRHKYSTRFLSIKLLENDPDIERIVPGHYQMRMRYSMSVIRCRSVFRTQ